MTALFKVSDVFLDAAGPLTPRDSSAAIIVNPAGDILLQLRDNRGDIFFPHHWGCFGGAADEGEDFHQTLVRELQEELNLTVDEAPGKPVTTITFRPKPDADDVILRHYYEIKVAANAMETLKLGEGSDFKFFTPREAMSLENATPYDKFAIWLYLNHPRLQSV